MSDMQTLNLKVFSLSFTLLSLLGSAELLADSNVTATNSLTSLGTLHVSGESTFNGGVYLGGPVVLYEGAATEGGYTPWTIEPTTAYWNVVLRDGLYIWGDRDTSASLDLQSIADYAFFWYPEKCAFRAVMTNNLNMKEENIGYGSFAAGRWAYASGEYSIAMQYRSYAYAKDSIVMGEVAEATGERSIVIGRVCEASGTDAISIGFLTFAAGERGVSLGKQNEANGVNSVTVGQYNFSNGDNSIAVGRYAVSDGDSSISLGVTVDATSYASTALGVWSNVSAGQDAEAWVPTDELLVIGNGDSDTTRSNAMVIYKNAETRFSGNLSVAGGVSLASPTGGIPMGCYGVANP